MKPFISVFVHKQNVKISFKIMAGFHFNMNEKEILRKRAVSRSANIFQTKREIPH